MPPRGFLDFSLLLERPLPAPSLLAFVLFFTEQVMAARYPESRLGDRFPLAVLRWVWPFVLLLWTVRYYPQVMPRLGLAPPESPLAQIAAVGATFLMLVASLVAWKGVSPRLQGPPFPFGGRWNLPPYVRLVVPVGEAFAHQSTFALIRVVGRSEVTMWAVCAVVALITSLAVFLVSKNGSRYMPRHTMLALTALAAGTGLMLSGHSLWAAVAWEWLFLAAVAT